MILSAKKSVLSLGGAGGACWLEIALVFWGSGLEVLDGL